MDRLALLGAVLGVTAIIGGNLLEGGTLESLGNGAAALIVFGGTIGAGLLQTPVGELQRALEMVRWILKPGGPDFDEGIDKVVGWCTHARRYGLVALERLAIQEQDDFLRRGLQLVADGADQLRLRQELEIEMNIREQRDLQAARFFEAMGGYAPTIGIIGAVLGLIQVMSNLGNPDALGAGIATAFVATIYGVGFANLILLPIAGKLRSLVLRQYQFREMIVEGLCAVIDGQNPMAVRSRLSGYLR